MINSNLVKLILCGTIAAGLGNIVYSKPNKSVAPVNKNLSVNVTGNGKITSPEKCSPEIGSGGNYIEPFGSLSGKCERGGTSPSVIAQKNNNFIQFKTNGSEFSGNDRTELARTSYYNFGRTLYISYKVRIPSDAPIHPIGKMYYALQLWQCSPLSPIAGMRITEGTSHDVNFITRHNNSSTPITHTYKLNPGIWHQFIIAANPNSTGVGSFQVWADGKDLGEWKGSYGSMTAKCSGSNNTPPQLYRVKWGIYKTNNSPKVYTIQFDDFKIGNTFDSVK